MFNIIFKIIIFNQIKIYIQTTQMIPFKILPLEAH